MSFLFQILVFQEEPRIILTVNLTGSVKLPLFPSHPPTHCVKSGRLHYVRARDRVSLGRYYSTAFNVEPTKNTGFPKDQNKMVRL